MPRTRPVRRRCVRWSRRANSTAEMFTLSAAVRIYVAAAPCDLRRGFDGLSALTRSVIGADPMSGHLFVFLNRR